MTHSTFKMHLTRFFCKRVDSRGTCKRQRVKFSNLNNMVLDSPAEKSFVSGIKPMIFIGTLLGVFSSTDMLSKGHSSCRLHYLLLLYSGTLFVFLAINSILMIKQYFHFVNSFGKDFMEELGEFTYVSYSISTAFVYGYQIFYVGSFRKLIQSFRSTLNNTNVNEYLAPKKYFSFTTFCWTLTIGLLLLGVTENILFDIQYLDDNDNGLSPNSTLATLYFYQNFSHWHNLIPTSSSSYRSFVTVILTGIVKIGTWGWIFCDTTVIILCYALALKFQSLNKAIQTDLIDPDNQLSSYENSSFYDLKQIKVMPLGRLHLENPKTKIDSTCTIKISPAVIIDDKESNVKSSGGFSSFLTWKEALHQFEILMDLTHQIEKYISPLIFTCFVCVGHTLITIFAQIAPDIPVSLSTPGSVHVYYSSFSYIFRVGIVTYFCGEVYHASQTILGTLEKCSVETYCQPVERLERKLIGNPIGISILGTFLITRHLMLSVVSFIFTTEIIFLQMANVLRAQKL